MRSQFLLVPLASLVAGVPAYAATYLTVEQAQAVLFPGASLTEDFRTLSNISGATLSCRHVTDGVKRLLATYALVLAPARD